jgi:hypothetical protein
MLLIAVVVPVRAFVTCAFVLLLKETQSLVVKGRRAAFAPERSRHSGLTAYPAARHRICCSTSCGRCWLRSNGIMARRNFAFSAAHPVCVFHCQAHCWPRESKRMQADLNAQYFSDQSYLVSHRTGQPSKHCGRGLLSSAVSEIEYERTEEPFCLSTLLFSLDAARASARKH